MPAKETPAFFCGNCGVVALHAANICNPQDNVKKVDWCGSRDMFVAELYKNRLINDRYRCSTCGKAAINAATFCEPENMARPADMYRDK